MGSSEVLHIIPGCCHQVETVFGPLDAFAKGNPWYCPQHGPTTIVDVVVPDGRRANADGSSALGGGCLVLLTMGLLVAVLTGLLMS